MQLKSNLIILLVGIIPLTSCSDYFEPDYKGDVDSDIFYEDLNNLRLGLNAVYNQIQTKSYQFSELLFGEAISDNCWTVQDVESGEVSQIVNFQFNTENSYILDRYSVNYKSINKANQIIRSIPYVKYRANGISETEIREVYGQAKVLRALFYFNLVKTFGGVSIQPENPYLDKLIYPRVSEDSVYAYIEKDLRESLLLLRRARYQLSEAGQIGIGGGLGLLMKVLLYQASPGSKLSPEKKAQKWQEALEIGRFFVEGKDVSINQLVKFDERYTESWTDFSKRLFLEPRLNKESVIPGQDVVSIHKLEAFDNLFRVSGEYSIESIIEINHYNYSGAGISKDEGWKLHGCLTNHGSTYGDELAVSVSQDLKDQFVNDPRELFTLTGRAINDYYRQESSPGMGNFTTGNGLLFTKFFVFPSEGGAAVRNYRIMRYTEVLLMYAEILNETGDTRKAIDYVNIVRQRARKLLDSSNPNSKFNTVTASSFKDIPYSPYDIARQAILKEKRVEMAGEFDRWFEMKRLGILSERMLFISRNLPVEASGQTRVRGKYFKKGVNELFPIPQKEVFISNGVIEQNFGY